MRSVGAFTRAQSGAKSIPCCSATLAAMMGGRIGAAITRAACPAAKTSRSRQVSYAARISGHNRIGAVAMNAGDDLHGCDMYRRCRSFGIQPGAGEDTKINDVTRSG